MKKRKKEFLEIIISCLLIIASTVIQSNEPIHYILCVIAYLLVGHRVIRKSFKNITRGKIFDENFLMTIASIGAFCIGETTEAVAVMLLYQIGELFQSYAVDKSRKSISDLMDIRPDYANVYRGNEVLKLDPEEVNVNEIILVKPGEKIPLDGKVIEGSSTIDTAALTGESMPRKIEKNEEVLSGCINNEGILKIKVSKKFEESTVSKILDLVENASSKKSKSENFISKFARVYTPTVVLFAVILAIIPPIIIKDITFTSSLHRALSFLVVSCPCALVISIPLSFFCGIGSSSKIGVLIKGSNYIEALSNVEIIVCDKTGTLTEGLFKVQKIEPMNNTKEKILKYAAYAENFSTHPIAISLKKAYSKKIEEKRITEVKETKGEGISATIEGKNVLVGNEKLMKRHGIKIKKSLEEGTIVYVAIDNEFAGTLTIADKIKEDAVSTISELKKNSIKIVMLTGDQDSISKSVAKKLNLDEYHAELLPTDKVSWIEKLMTQKSTKGKLVFIGDGINDAPVLALADIGVAMGALGSDAAIEAADIVIMTDEPSKILTAMKISKKTMKIVKENIIFAISVKIGVLILSALGITNMWLAIFADVGVTLLAIINSLRNLNAKKFIKNITYE